MEELYNQLYKDGKYTKTFDDFQMQFDTPEKSEKLYTALNQAGDYTKSFSDFQTQFSIAGKTNDSANADPNAESGKSDMGSNSEKPLSAWQSIKNSFLKAGERIGDIGEFWGAEEGMGSALDIATNSTYALLVGQNNIDSFVESVGEDSWLAGGLGTKETLEAIEKYKKEQEESAFETKQITESIKQGDIAGAGAGIVEALVNGISSVAYFLGTAGAGVYSENLAENYITYNEQKAKNLGISMPELIKSGKADNLAPVGLGAISVALERFGLGKVAKVAGGNSIVKNLSNKLIYNRSARNVADLFAAGATEFTTEILQHATDKVNEELGRTAGTDLNAEVVSSIGDAIFSQEGLEAGLQGFFGGGGMAAGGRSVKALNTIRTTVDGDLVHKNLEDLAVLRVKLNTEKDTTIKEGIELDIKSKEQEIADSVIKGNIIHDSLTDEQLSEVESLTDLADVAAYKITELNKKLRFGQIDQAGYDMATQGFTKQYEQARQGLINMNLEQNIKTAEDIAKEKGLDLDVMTTAEVEALMNSDKVSEQNKKDYFDDKSKGYDISAFAVGNKIIIDKDIARKTGSINAGMHEVLHPVFNKLIGGVKEQGKIVKQFRRNMTSSQRRFVDAQMKKRGYTSNKQYNTEYINVFSDALRKKQINYDKTTFEKIGDAIVSIFKPIGYTNIGFESGKDVYNFIKEFDQSAEQGKLTAKAAEALKGVDLSDAGLRDELQTSKTQLEGVKNRLSGIPATDVTSRVNVNKISAELPAMIGTQINNRFANLDPDTREEFTFDVLEKILRPNKEGVNRDLQWDGRGDLYGFLNGRIGLRIKDAVREDYNRPESERMYVGRIDAKQLEDLTREPSTEPTTETAPKNKTASTEESVERGQATFDELDIVDDALIADIEKDLAREIRTRVQKGTLSETVAVKKGSETYLVTWLEDYVNKQLFKKLSKKLGAIGEKNGKTAIPGAYIDFLNDPKTFDIITKALPIKSIKKSYNKLFPTERIGRELTAEGNPVFRIKKINKPEFFKYFVEGKKSTILERQKQLFREILEPLAKQVVADYATPKNIASLKEIQELAPAESTDVINNITIEAGLNNLESQIDRYKGEQKSFDIIQFSLTKTERSEIANKLGIESDSNITMAQLVAQVISQTLRPLIKERKAVVQDIEYKLGPELFEKLQNTVIGPYLDSLQALQNKKSYERGTFAEQLAWDAFKGVKGITMVSKRPDGKAGSSAPDIVINYKGQNIIFEIKSNRSDRITSVNIYNYTNSEKYQTTRNTGVESEQVIFDQLKKSKNLNSFISKVKKMMDKFYPGENYLDKNGYIELTPEQIEKLDLKNSLYKETITYIEGLNEKLVETIYNEKGANYVGFIDIGTFYVGNNKNNLAVPKFKADLYTRAWLYMGKIKDNGKHTFPLRMFAQISTESSKKLGESKTKSIIDTSSISSILQPSKTKAEVQKNELIQFSKTLNKAKAMINRPDAPQKGISVWDFDDTLATTKSNVLYTLPGESIVYNGSPKSFSELGKRTGFIFLATEIKEAQEYANSNRGEVRPITVDNNKLATEETVIDIMEELGIATDEGLLYEMIDSRFEDFFIGKENMDKVKESLKKNGYGGFKYEDGSQISSKGTESIAIIDKSIIKEPSKINATEFALQADQLAAKGAEFDFSEFSKVMKGAKGPMFEKAVVRNKKFGNDNVYILTARPADSKYAIHEFLKGIGLNIKLENIVGLGDGTAIAKAKWIISKVAEGYNDFYFADDAYKNVKAVQEVLEQADVKSKVHQAKVQFSKDLNKDFNNIIQDATGISAAKDISTAKSKILARDKGRFKFFIPPSADDFAGLLYKLTGKGTKGEQQQAWFKQALFDPFAKAMREFESYKQNVTTIVNQLKKDIKNVPAGLKKINESGFTNENAVRVYLWVKNGYDIDGLNQEDIQELVDIVEGNQDLLDFADQMDAALDGYPEPQNDWLAGTITTDAINMINTSKRAEFLQEWQQNADVIFSKENLNKLRAAFGENYVEALQDMLYRMKTGRNRPSGANKLTNQFMNWVNDSVGTIMFFNTRSALLQTLSTVNFINWGDNNPIAAAKAFANQKQFWSDFAMLFNSDFLKQRRSGLKNDVNADDIANAAETATNKTKAVLSSLLKVGFLPTQIADSFAIALGGASFVRNRINKYVSEGMDKQAAEEQAFLDFQEIAEETQQSSRPDRISQQQASPLGRIILAFANTPMQYMRLTKKAFLDLKNKRGDAKTNITKIVYYMAVQNIIFSSLQAALFAALFDDDEEALEEKELRVANSMLDSILRGVGIYGAIASTLKNITLEIKRQADKDRPDFTVAAQRALSISPPIDSKMRKLMSAARAFSYKTTREKMTGYGLDNPAYYAVGQIVSATTNVPLDRAIRKADNLRVAVDNDTKYWQSIALALGYSQWDVGLVETSKDKKKKTGFGKTTNWKKSNWNKSNWKKD